MMELAFRHMESVGKENCDWESTRTFENVVSCSLATRLAFGPTCLFFNRDTIIQFCICMQKLVSHLVDTIKLAQTFNIIFDWNYCNDYKSNFRNNGPTGARPALLWPSIHHSLSHHRRLHLDNASIFVITCHIEHTVVTLNRKRSHFSYYLAFILVETHMWKLAPCTFPFYIT